MSAQLLGASCVIVGDLNADRLAKVSSSSSSRRCACQSVTVRCLKTCAVCFVLHCRCVDGGGCFRNRFQAARHETARVKLHSYLLLQVKEIGCETVNVASDEPIPDQIYRILGSPEVGVVLWCGSVLPWWVVVVVVFGAPPSHQRNATISVNVTVAVSIL